MVHAADERERLRCRTWPGSIADGEPRRSAHPDGKRTAAAAGRPRRLKVSDLLAGEREAILEHDGQDYRLRITANGKLILTK